MLVLSKKVDSHCNEKVLGLFKLSQLFFQGLAASKMMMTPEILFFDECKVLFTQAALSSIRELAVILINFTLAQRGYLSLVGFC